MADISIIKPGLRTSVAESLYNEILLGSNNYYYFLGKTLIWDGTDQIETPINNGAYEAATRDEIIMFKKITSADVSFTVPRYDWKSGDVFDMYDDRIDSTNPAYSGATSLEAAKFYCVTADYRVYKCLDNNGNSPSTVKPFGTAASTLKTSDGYIWKYMYTIPAASRNKFMTALDMPVTTAIKSQYFSRGSINSAVVTSYGKNYTAATTLTVFGDGYLQDNQIEILQANIIEAGAGYLTATVTIEDPFDAELFATTTPYILGQYVKAGNNIYEVVAAGTSGSVSPTHTSPDIIYNGTVGFKFVGITATATATVGGGEVTDITFLGVIGYINLTNAGYGYVTAPNVSITDSGDGANGAATAIINAEGRVVSIIVTNRGVDYTLPSVVFSDPFSGDPWGSGDPVLDEDIIYYDSITYGKNYYQVIGSGDLGTSPPVHTSGSVVNGDVTLAYIGTTAAGTVDLYYGYGYSFTPLMTISAPDGGGTTTQATAVALTGTTKAKLTPIIENGELVGVVAVDPGVGYTNATIVVTGAGEGAEVVPNLNVGDLNTVQANIELLAVPGTIDAIKVTNAGSGYTAGVPTITIDGDGSGCTAQAIVTDGAITGITVLTPGSGYTKATVTITGNGTNATARAIVSPYNGHGRNAIAELFAKDITLFSSVAADRNQSFAPDNDYRQIGIIKNPQVFGTNLRFNSVLGSACYSVTCSGSSGNDIDLDMLIYDADNKEYRVVSKVEGTGSVSLLLQSLDNEPLSIGKTLYYDVGITQKTLSVSSYADPTVNKYSGNLMFIDNRNLFKPSSDQTVSIKTTIRL